MLVCSWRLLNARALDDGTCSLRSIDNERQRSTTIDNERARKYASQCGEQTTSVRARAPTSRLL